MLEPVELADFFITFFSAGMIILFGAVYALLFAWSRVRNHPGLMPLAYAAYGILVVNVYLLANATHLSGHWQIVVYTMLSGYLLAPHGIWHLCIGTHPENHCRQSMSAEKTTNGGSAL